MAMVARAVKRRNDWVDFHTQEFNEDEEHEKKLRFNYFADSHLTNPAMRDFRPTPKNLKSTRPGMVMKQDIHIFKSSQNVGNVHGRFENKQSIV